MKNSFLIKLTLFFMVMFSLTVFAQQTDSLSTLQKVETSTISTLDEFITKYEPKISGKMGELWGFMKSTSESMYSAFVRYLIVKDSFPIVIGLILLGLLKMLTNRLKKFFDSNSPLFEELNEENSYTQYEKLMIKRDNRVYRIYNNFFNALAPNLFYIGLAVIVYNLLPYLYNISLLIISPEVRVVMELTNIYKSL